MLSFNVFGFPIKIQPFFWILCVLVSSGQLQQGGTEGVLGALIITAVIFATILLHELGHAWTRKRYGAPYSEITLHGFGGFCAGPGEFTRWQSIQISFAGPLMNFIIAGIAFALDRTTHIHSPYLDLLLYFAILFNLILGIFNLFPIYPLDGGQIFAQAMGPRRFKMVLWIGIILAGLIAVGSIVSGQFFGAIICGMLAFENWQRLQSRPAF